MSVNLSKSSGRVNLEWNGYLCHRGDSWGSRGSDIDLSGYLIRDNLLGAVAGDVAGLAALVASLARGV